MNEPTAVISYNATSQAWEAVYRGTVIAKTSNPKQDAAVEYLTNVIEGGLSKKARNLGVKRAVFVDRGGEMPEGDTRPEMLNPAAVNIPRVEDEFSINERFDILDSTATMVAKRIVPSALITGEGGLGKSYTVLRAIKRAGLKNMDDAEPGAKFDGQRGYVVVKGYSTAKGLYRTLYENRNQIVIFDDCDSVLRDPVSANLLKAALDSYDVRIVTWNAESFGDDDLPRSFEFTGGVIFISNLPMAKVPQAIRSRALPADVSMTRAEVIERMASISTSEEFMPEYDDKHKAEAMEFIAKNADNPLIVTLNLRSLVNAVKIRSNDSPKWEREVLYALANA